MDCASFAKTNLDYLRSYWLIKCIVYIEIIMEIVINMIYYTFMGAIDSLLYTIHNFEIIECILQENAISAFCLKI